MLEKRNFTVEDLNAIGRSLVYHPAFILSTLAMGVALAPALFGKDEAVKAAIPYRWTKWALRLQADILRLTYEVKYCSQLPQGRAIFAVKHQSAWETMALWHIIDRPVFVLKKELLDIPVFGAYLKAADNIAIDRSAGKGAMEDMLRQAHTFLQAGRNIVIFPEGTRTAIDAQSRYKQGISYLYEAFNVPIYPVALNSGCFWGRNAFIRRAGVIDVEILPAIPKGLSRDMFMDVLQQQIEGITKRLVKQARYREVFEYY
jgi:1-acyl-sn-glycerol-3-phosphate acyltransferase